MGYVATTIVIIYWKPDHPFVINIANNAWFGKYNYCLFKEDNHTQYYLPLQQYPESLIHYSYLLNLIPC